MKKVIMMLAAVAMAACAQAATTSWSFSTGDSVLKAGYTGAGSSSAIMSNTTVYWLFAEGVTDPLFDVSAQNALLNGLRNGSIKASDIATMAIASAVTDAAGKITTDNAVTFTMTSVEVGAKAVFYEVVLSPDNDFIFLSAPFYRNAYAEGETASITFGSNMTTSIVDADGTAEYIGYMPGWYAISVGNIPEPTSGLLILLGMAGLALKRKVA